jgi:hypothetical protein
LEYYLAVAWLIIVSCSLKMRLKHETINYITDPLAQRLTQLP